jgi:hypothetical protein
MEHAAFHLAALKRLDHDITTLLHTTKHVVIYKMVNSTWVCMCMARYHYCHLPFP